MWTTRPSVLLWPSLHRRRSGSNGRAILPRDLAEKPCQAEPADELMPVSVLVLKSAADRLPVEIDVEKKAGHGYGCLSMLVELARARNGGQPKD